VHAATQEAATILARAEETYEGVESLRATFRQVIEVPLLDRMREGRGLWYQKGRNLFMMDFNDPEGDVLVADGQYLWAYYPSQDPKQVVRSAIDSSTTGTGTADFHSKILDEARTDFIAAPGGIDTVSGSSAYVIILTPKDTSRYRRIRLWIDLETFLIRRFEFTELSETVRIIELENIQLDVEIEDHIFRFEPPPAAEVFKGK
jgi:outer membrane lipoprotein-sorting protein